MSDMHTYVLLFLLLTIRPNLQSKFQVFEIFMVVTYFSSLSHPLDGGGDTFNQTYFLDL